MSLNCKNRVYIVLCPEVVKGQGKVKKWIKNTFSAQFLGKNSIPLEALFITLLSSFKP